MHKKSGGQFVRPFVFYKKSNLLKHTFVVCIIFDKNAGGKMNCDIDKLATILGLSQYQKSVLMANRDAYNMSRLVKRGCALYAPRAASRNIFDFVRCIFCGRRADLIGRDKMLVRNTRGIDFRARGFYSAPVGRYRYYADDAGNIIARDVFIRETGRK